jgi:hypothetical protein
MTIPDFRDRLRRGADHSIASIILVALVGFLGLVAWVIIGLLTNDQHPLFPLPSSRWCLGLKLYLITVTWWLIGLTVQAVSLWAIHRMLRSRGCAQRAIARRGPILVVIALILGVLTYVEVALLGHMPFGAAVLPQYVGLALSLLIGLVTQVEAMRERPQRSSSVSAVSPGQAQARVGASPKPSGADHEHLSLAYLTRARRELQRRGLQVTLDALKDELGDCLRQVREASPGGRALSAASPVPSRALLA